MSATPVKTVSSIRSSGRVRCGLSAANLVSDLFRYPCLTSWEGCPLFLKGSVNFLLAYIEIKDIRVLRQEILISTSKSKDNFLLLDQSGVNWDSDIFQEMQ